MSTTEQDELDPKLDSSDLWYNTYKAMPYKDLAAKMLELRERAALADSELKAFNKELDVIRLRVVPERFQSEGLSSLNIPGVGRLGIAADAHCSQIPDRKEEFFDWLRENEYEDLIKPTINPSSLKSLVKDIAKSESEADVEFNPAEDAVTTDKSQFEQICEFVNYIPFMRASVTKGR